MLEQLAEYYGVTPDAIVRYTVVDEGASVRVLVNYGIGGIKVLYVKAAQLAEPDDDLGIYDLSYREIQALAKAGGIPANQGRDDLIAALWPAEDEEE